MNRFEAESLRRSVMEIRGRLGDRWMASVLRPTGGVLTDKALSEIVDQWHGVHIPAVLVGHPAAKAAQEALNVICLQWHEMRRGNAAQT